MASMENKNSVVNQSDLKKQPVKQAKVQGVQEQLPVHPLGFKYEIWDGDSSGWTKVTSKRRHKK